MRPVLVALTAIIIPAIGISTQPLSSRAVLPAAPPWALAFDHFVPRSDEAVHKGGVDHSVGLYIREDEDLIVTDVIPLVLRRTYLSGDHVSRQFGIGGTHPGEWYLIGDSATFQWAELILADGGRIHFNRDSLDTSSDNPRFEHLSTPTAFWGSKLERAGLEWALRFTDGSVALFQRCSVTKTHTCALVEIRDADGRRIRYVRDPTGLLLQIQGPTREIAFDYDAHGRVIRAYDSLTHGVSYSYDERGRLTQVVASDGTIREYTYNERDEMITIDEPGWVIHNTFDDAGRVVRQITQLSPPEELITFEFAYTVVDGSIVQTDMTRNGERTRYTYNSSHYELTETIDADGPNPLSVTYDRSAATNAITALTLQCIGPDGNVIRTVAATQQTKDFIVGQLVRRECR